jgi:hypothetical protein
LTPSVRSHVLAVISRKASPALFTSTSRRPSLAIASATIRSGPIGLEEVGGNLEASTDWA